MAKKNRTSNFKGSLQRESFDLSIVDSVIEKKLFLHAVTYYEYIFYYERVTFFFEKVKEKWKLHISTHYVTFGINGAFVQALKADPNLSLHDILLQQFRD